MKKIAVILALSMMATVASAEVIVSVADVNGLAAIQYQCTAGETVRGFGLNVTVSTGTITGISGFHIGESTAESKGYGIFLGAFARAITVDPNTGVVDEWDIEDYTPIANVDDYEDDTLAGLDTDGVTLELGGLWDVDDETAIPDSSGILCYLSLSNEATVSIAANVVRAGTTGIVLVDPTETASVSFVEDTVTPLD